MTVTPAQIYTLLKAHRDSGCDNLGKLSRDIAALFPSESAEPIGYLARNQLEDYRKWYPGLMITMASKGTFRPENEIPVYLGPPHHINPRHFEILAEALSEIKATSDGLSDQPIADIIAGCLAEIEALKGSTT